MISVFHQVKVEIILCLLILLQVVFQYHLSFVSSLPSSYTTTKIIKANRKELIFRGSSSSKLIFQNPKSFTKNDDADITTECSIDCQNNETTKEKDSSIVAWLDDHESSNPHLLGCLNIKEVSDSVFECAQPSVSWFGYKFIPVFVSHISRKRFNEKKTFPSTGSTMTSPYLPFSIKGGGDARHQKEQHLNEKMESSPTTLDSDDDFDYEVKVEIKDSKTYIDNGGNEKKAGKLVNIVKKVMESCQFKGLNTITCHRCQHINNYETENHEEKNQDDIWEIRSDLSIELRITFPDSKLIILPPGINSLGGRIVQSICNKRGNEVLAEIKNQYFSWLLQ